MAQEAAGFDLVRGAGGQWWVIEFALGDYEHDTNCYGSVEEDRLYGPFGEEEAMALRARPDDYQTWLTEAREQPPDALDALCTAGYRDEVHLGDVAVGWGPP